VQPMARRTKVARELKFCGLWKGPDFKRVLPIFRGWPASGLARRAWHMQTVADPDQAYGRSVK